MARAASASSCAPRLVLFDVDGTLLSCGAQVGRIFLRALGDVFGGVGRRAVGLARGYSFAGRTDPRIATDLLERAGLDRDAVEQRLDQLRSRYLELLEPDLDPAGIRVLPGVTELLRRLQQSPDVTVGLLTGNWRGGAEVKLRAAGLGAFFAPAAGDGVELLGAFGDDGIDRCELPPVALERARLLTGRSFEPSEVLLIGDTLEDVRCARRHRLPVLGVATGGTSADELTRGGADYVAASLEALPVEWPELGITGLGRGARA